MKSVERIVADMESVFAESSYPEDFLAVYDQMECLANHKGRETFLVRRKDDGASAVATCYDRAVFPLRPDIRLLQSLEHSGLPHYYARYENDRMICVVREYIEGETLNAYVREQQLSLEEIIRIARELCDILEVLHTHVPQVVHRDIKPENIIVKPDGGIALIDFDIARAVREGADSDTFYLGTRGYAPPEQYGFGPTDSRADIYAFGVLLRWLVTGSVKPNGNIVIDADLQRVIDRCTAFAPDERYADIGQVRQALAGVGSGGRRIRPGVLAGCILTALLLLCLGFAAGRYTDWLRPVPKVTFKEPLIERAARLWIGKEAGRLTAEDLSQVTHLYIYGTEAFSEPDLFYQCDVASSTMGSIRTLDDLALLPNLEELHIIHQGHVDMAGVSGLAKLRTIELKHMRLYDITPVAELPGLRHAILFCDNLSDVTALENCPLLETLDIGLNDITSLEQVGFHPNVKSLGLMWLELDNLDDIARRLPNTQAVTLQHGNIRDMSGLGSLPDLESVYVLAEQEDDVRALFEGTEVQIHVTEN